MKPAILALLAALAAGGEPTAYHQPFDAGALPYRWVAHRGQWRAVEGTLQQSDLATRGAYAWWSGRAFGDTAVSVRFRPSARGSGVRAAGLCVRYADSEHGYYAHLDAGNQQVILVRQSADKPWHELARAKGVAIELDAWHEARLTAEGPALTLHLDGRAIVTATDATYDAGYAGLRAGQGEIAFDDFAVTGTPVEMPPFEVRRDSMSLEDAPRIEVLGDRLAAAEGGGYFPVLVTLADGSLGAAIRGGAPHIGLAGRLDWIRSTDGGVTWSAPTVIVDSEWDDRNPAVGTMPDGSVVVAYAEAQSYNAAGEFDRSAGPYVLKFVRSTDNGATWSAPQALAPVIYDAGSPYGRIVTLPDGTALMPVYHSPRSDVPRQQWRGELTSDGRRGCSVLRSADNGLTWGDASWVHEDYNEFSLAVMPGGRLVAAMRSWSGGLATCESSDGGRTWTEPVPATPKNVHPADLLPLDGDTLLLVAGCRVGPNGVVATLSDDGGRTFDAAELVFVRADAYTTDCGYPSVQRLPDGTLALLWYAVGTPEQPGAQARCVRFTEAAMRAAMKDGQ